VEVRAILEPAEQDRLKGVALGYLREHSYLSRRCGVQVNQGRRGMRAYEHQCERKIVGVVFRRLRFTPEPAPLFCCAQHIKAEACAPDVVGAVLLPASEIEAIRRRYETIDLPAWLAAQDERDNQRRQE
jgi:hypothetical protein